MQIFKPFLYIFVTALVLSAAFVPAQSLDSQLQRIRKAYPDYDLESASKKPPSRSQEKSGTGYGTSTPGPYIAGSWSDFSGESFSPNDMIVSTYFFYWYIAPPVIYSSLTQLPDYNLSDYTYENKDGYTSGTDWMANDVTKIAEAGINLILPVYWGPSDWPTKWKEKDDSYSTMTENLNLAMDRVTSPDLDLLDESYLPKIGMFYDTFTLGGTVDTSGTAIYQVDLTTTAGKDQFYRTIRDFYSRINPQYWARIEDKPIVWLYDSYKPGKKNPDAFGDAATSFGLEFGGCDLFFIGDAGWETTTELWI